MSTTKKKLEKIQKATGQKINSYKVINAGGESLVIEVNGVWIFRFPRNQILKDKTKEQLNFIASFSKVSPLQLPAPRYIEQDFIGYKKIPGKPLYKTNLKKLTEQERVKIAEQIGLFLKTLHGYKDKHIDFDTGYLIMRKEDYKTCPKIIAKYLTIAEQGALNIKLRKIANNPLNFEKPATIIHGDFYFNNIIWDSKRKIITGVIDWSNAGIGVPAMDFIMLADFNSGINDKFLKNILKYYGTNGDNLFYQIKENAIIDVMNWFWTFYKEKKSKGIARMIKKLKKIL